MEALWLTSLGLSHREIVRLTGISPHTLRKYLQDYLEGGIEKLKEINFNRPTSKLTEHQQKIEDYFRSNPPANINEAIVKIENLTVTNETYINAESICELLKKLAELKMNFPFLLTTYH